MTLQELFNSKYTYDGGQLISKHTGKPIQKTVNGYLCCELRVEGKTVHYRVHRVIYCMHHGAMPDIIDHIDGNILNNRIENLRAATLQQNAFNRRASVRNKLGVKGVCLNTSNDKVRYPYAAFIKTDGKRRRIGSFATIEEAKIAYDNEARKHFGTFAPVA